MRGSGWAVVAASRAGVVAVVVTVGTLVVAVLLSEGVQ